MWYLDTKRVVTIILVGRKEECDQQERVQTGMEETKISYKDLL